MTSKFAPSRSVPSGFDEELRFFTREILRSFPPEASADPMEWALNFGSEYFANGGRETILAARAAAEPPVESSSSATISFPTAEQLELQLATLFEHADKDGNGVLDRTEFKSLMKMFAEELHLGMSDLRQIMLLADDNGDGVIEYREFVPLATELLQMIYAKMRHEQAQADRGVSAADNSVSFLLNGMTASDLESTLKQLFHDADKDASGYLDRKEFFTALRDSDLGLTKKQIRMLMQEADMNGDGRISYEEFSPLAFSLLAEMVAKQLEYEQLPSDEAAAVNYLTGIFTEYDVDGTGRLHVSTVKQAFRDSDIGLTNLQLRALLGLCVVDERGELSINDFAMRAASMIAAIVSVQTDSDKAAKVVAARAGASALTVLGMDRYAFRDMIAGALTNVDTSGSGRATLGDVRGVLSGDLNMDEHNVGALLALAREGGVDDDGTVDINFIAEYAFDQIVQLAQLEALATY